MELIIKEKKLLKGRYRVVYYKLQKFLIPEVYNKLINKYKKMLHGIILAFGLFLIWASIRKLKATLAFLNNGQRTYATIVNLEPRREDKGETYYYPTYKFKDNNNQEILFKSNFSTSRSRWEEVEIVYDPKDSTKVKLLTYTDMFWLEATLLAIAMPFTVVGGGYFVALVLLE